MKIAIHYREGGFAKQWIAYCKAKQYDFKIVNCYANSIVEDLKGVDFLFWHFHRYEIKNAKIADGLLSIFEQIGVSVFPNKATRLSFDEKILQKFVFDTVQGTPTIETNVFFDKEEASQFIKRYQTEKFVFKLSKGAGSKNVQLVNKKKALHLVKVMFTKGFSSFITPFPTFRISIPKMLYDCKRYFFSRLPFTKLKNKYVGIEFGYAYFQEFLQNNDHDIRVVVIGNKAIGIRRFVPKNSFKASGSGLISHDPKDIPKETIVASFKISQQMGFQSMAYDFVKHPTKGYLPVEMCLGVAARSYDICPGYWDENLQWHDDDNIKLENIIIESVLK